MPHSRVLFSDNHFRLLCFCVTSRTRCFHYSVPGGLSDLIRIHYSPTLSSYAYAGLSHNAPGSVCSPAPVSQCRLQKQPVLVNSRARHMFGHRTLTTPPSVPYLPGLRGFPIVLKNSPSPLWLANGVPSTYFPPFLAFYVRVRPHFHSSLSTVLLPFGAEPSGLFCKIDGRFHQPPHLASTSM